MAKIFSEDAYCLGLLYSYLFAGKKMVLKDDLDAFYNTIEKNLENTDAFDLYATVWHDDEPCIYYPSEGKNGEVYYVLYPNFNIDRAKSKYIGCLSTQVLVATQKENALNCLGLQLKDGRICKRNNYHIGIVSATTFMNQFIEKLKSGELKIEKCPQVEEDSELTEEYIIKQLESYQKLLESEVIEKATNKLNIRDASYLIEKAKVAEIKKSEDHDRLSDETNVRIEEGRRREAKAWHDAQNYIVDYNEEGPVKKLVPNNKK